MKNTDWLRRAAVMLLAAACSALSYGRDVGIGNWRLAKGAVREGDLLTIDSSVGGPNCNAFAEVDLSPCADVGYEAEISCRGENVARGPEPWLGMKFMLSYYDERNEGHWPQATPMTGSFGWTVLRFRHEMRGLAARNGKGTLTLGFQSGGGRIVFDLSTLKVRVASPLWPVTNRDYRVSYPADVRALPPLRGVMLPSEPCREDDFRTLKAWGATLARYQMTRLWGKDNTNQDLSEYDRWLNEKLDHLDRVVLPLAEKHAIRIVIDLHVAPGGRCDGEMNMFHDRKYADHFIACWQRIARRFRGRRSIFGYDLINEPEQRLPALPDCDYWNLQRRAAEAVRSIDPETAIIIESNGWDCADAYRYLCPLSMDNVIYQVHVYDPGEFTHQGVQNPRRWARSSYPDAKRGWDKDYLRRVMEPVLAFQRRHGARIYVGEFSAITWADGADRYIADCISLFNEYGFDWTYHAFREWPGWSVEHECEAPGGRFRPSSDNPRLRVLKAGLLGPSPETPAALGAESAR